jgi:hypothetical protein
MLQREVLVLEFVAIDAFAAGAIAPSEVALHPMNERLTSEKQTSRIVHMNLKRSRKMK